MMCVGKAMAMYVGECVCVLDDCVCLGFASCQGWCTLH